MRIGAEADVDALGRAAKLLAVASAWSELGLWDVLAGRDEAVELSELPGDPRALAICAPVLAHAGLLDGDGHRWAMSETARTLHARGELPHGHNLDWFGDLGRMAQVLREGGPVRSADGVPKLTTGGVRVDDRERTRAFLDMLYRRSEQSAAEVARWLVPRLSDGAAVLDLGGGHGRYARLLAERGCTVTLLDLPIVVELARERHGEALRYLTGDFHTAELGGPYDAALLSNIVHGEPPEACAALVARLFAALAPGGQLVLKDMFIDEQGRDPENAVMFGVTMLYYTQRGQSYTVADVRAWCAAAGFASVEVIALASYSLLIARKP